MIMGKAELKLAIDESLLDEAEASGAELLVCARDNGTRLAPSTRYIVEHAPCPVLLV